MKFIDELKEQRWDDHRYYHHSRINQSLHLISAMSFLGAYTLLFINPVMAAFLGWIVAMVTRQIGHFFFEPKGYDEINQASHEHKENIKVGYNLKRKIILLTIWGLSPVVLYMNPTLFGVFNPYVGTEGYLYNLSIIWLVIGAGALIFRTIHLFFIYDITAGLVWFTKILTDPFHDIKIYHKSPFYLLKGELLDPMHHVK
ncbi:MAG: hypothetical protein PVG20_09735 [Thioalkalispiraceae bacterium]|jgi:hypothetical protein